MPFVNIRIVREVIDHGSEDALKQIARFRLDRLCRG